MLEPRPLRNIVEYLAAAAFICCVRAMYLVDRLTCRMGWHGSGREQLHSNRYGSRHRCLMCRREWFRFH